MKLLFNLSIAFTFNIILIILENRKRVYCIVFMIFFPLIIQVFGKDALSVPTISIYLFSTIFFLTHGHLKLLFKHKRNILVLLLMCVAVVSTLHVPFGEFTSMAVRKLSNFISSALLFLLIVNLPHPDRDALQNFIERLMSILLISISLQILISVLIMNFPELGNVLNYFTFRNENVLEMEQTRGIMRIRSLILTPESFGEIIAVATPFVLYKMFKGSFVGWLFVYFLFSIGEILSVTRSGMVLFCFSSFLFLALNFHRIKISRLYCLAVCVPIAGILIIAKNPDFISDAATRFSNALVIYEKTGNIAATINRAGVWDMKEYLLSKLNLFGHGLIPAFRYGDIGFHFHNLWLTLTFEFGIAGVFLFVLFFLSMYTIMVRRFFKAHVHERLLITVPIIALTVFLINEFKYEFNREEAYQQLCWAFFSLFFLISDSLYKKNMPLNKVQKEINDPEVFR